MAALFPAMRFGSAFSMVPPERLVCLTANWTKASLSRVRDPSIQAFRSAWTKESGTV